MNLTTQRELIVLLSLVELSGQGTKQEVLDYIKTQGFLKFTAEDLEILTSRNELKWRNALAFVRQSLKEKKLLQGTDNSWEITEQGRRYFQTIARQVLTIPITELAKITPNAIEAIQDLDLGQPSIQEIRTMRLKEGSRRQQTVNIYERNRRARNLCLQKHGAKCAVCGLDFGRQYGPEAEGFIHVHHTKPLSEIGQEYQVDPETDLRPVCPNCHAVIHLKTPPFTIVEVKQMLTRNKK